MGKIERPYLYSSIIDGDYRYRLVREGDSIEKQSSDIRWVEFNDDGRYKGSFKEIAGGRSLLMSPFNNSFTWQTTLVTEVVEDTEWYIKFKTENSTYELFITQDDTTKRILSIEKENESSI
jgi:hypothetical protein